MWDKVRRPNLRTKGIHKGEESQVNVIDQMFNKIIEENLSKLRKGILS